MGKHLFIKDMRENNDNNGFKRITQEEIAEKRISAYHSSLNDLQLYDLYCSLSLATRTDKSRIYPKYVKITGRSFSHPHPHRYFTFEEFIDCLYKDENFKNVILGRN
jgi:hypothetical protein